MAEIGMIPYYYNTRSSMFTMSPLPYRYDALEPYIDALTMEVHYTKHYQGYVDQLNAAVEKHPELFERSLTDLVANLSSRSRRYTHGGEKPRGG